MGYRVATINDVTQMQRVRHAVKENTLSDPSLVPDDDVIDYITVRGRGWVFEEDGIIRAFAIVSVIDQNVWALFVEPGHEKKGIGKALHGIMMDWYFSQSDQRVWLGTAPFTRAHEFYLKQGWTQNGNNGSKEIRFEMTSDQWNNLKKHQRIMQPV